MRPRKFILPQTGTGGYGIRPYVFVAAERGMFFPVACVGATIGRPSTYRRNAFSGTVFL